MTPSEELAPCPFCGSAEVSISYSATMQSPEPAARFVECEACAAMGPSHEIQGDAPDRDEYTQSKAIVAWNTRQSADLIESMPDVERIRREAFEEAAKVAYEYQKRIREPHDWFIAADIAARIRSLSPRPDPRQDEEGVIQADEVERVATAIIVCNGDLAGGGVAEAEARRILASEDAADAGMAHAARELARAAIASMDPVRQVAWQPIETAPKDRGLLVAYRNRLGNWRVVKACFYTQLPWSEDYDPRPDEGEYAPAGWYEESETHEQLLPIDGEPTHWQPLPPPPALASADAVMGEGE